MVFERFVYNCKAVRRTLAGLRHNDNHAVRERTGPVLLGAGSPVATRIAWRNGRRAGRCRFWPARISLGGAAFLAAAAAVVVAADAAAGLFFNQRGPVPCGTDPIQCSSAQVARLGAGAALRRSLLRRRLEILTWIGA